MLINDEFANLCSYNRSTQHVHGNRPMGVLDRCHLTSLMFFIVDCRCTMDLKAGPINSAMQRILVQIVPMP